MMPSQTEFRENAHDDGYEEGFEKGLKAGVCEQVDKRDLRDQFAMAATDKEIAEIVPETIKDICNFVGVEFTSLYSCTDEVVISARCKARYMFADAMLKARVENE